MAISSTSLNYDNFSSEKQRLRMNYLKKVFSTTSSKNVKIIAQLLSTNVISSGLSFSSQRQKNNFKNFIVTEFSLLSQNLDTILGANNWDFYVEYHPDQNKYQLSLLRYVESYTVRNENGESTVIKDNFTKIPLYFNTGEQNSYAISFGIFEFIRTTFDYLHTSKNKNDQYTYYLHSHVSTIDKTQLLDMRFMSRCLGSSDLSTYFSGFTTEENPQRDEDTLQYYFYYLDSYFNWESLQGGPYRRISSLVGPIGEGQSQDDRERQCIESFINSFKYVLNNYFGRTETLSTSNFLERRILNSSRDFRRLSFESPTHYVTLATMDIAEELDFVSLPSGEIKLVQNEKLKNFILKYFFVFIREVYSSAIETYLNSENPLDTTFGAYFRTLFVVPSENGEVVSYDNLYKTLKTNVVFSQKYKDSFLVFNGKENYVYIKGNNDVLNYESERQAQERLSSLPSPENFEFNPIIYFYVSKYIESQLQRGLYHKAS